MTDRRQFVAGLGALLAAPALVRAEALMRVVVPGHSWQPVRDRMVDFESGHGLFRVRIAGVLSREHGVYTRLRNMVYIQFPALELGDDRGVANAWPTLPLPAVLPTVSYFLVAGTFISGPVDV